MCVRVRVRVRVGVCVCVWVGQEVPHRTTLPACHSYHDGVRGGLICDRRVKTSFHLASFCIAFAFSDVVLMALSRHLQTFC